MPPESPTFQHLSGNINVNTGGGRRRPRNRPGPRQYRFSMSHPRHRQKAAVNRRSRPTAASHWCQVPQHRSCESIAFVISACWTAEN